MVEVVIVTPDPIPVFGAPQTVSGFRLVDARASYGIGLESFVLGFPMHFDFSWKTLFKGWTLDDVLRHLHQGDCAVLATLDG